MRRPPQLEQKPRRLQEKGTASRLRGHFTTARTTYREMDVTYWLESVEAKMRQLELRRGGAHS